MSSPYTPGVGLEPKYLAGRDQYLQGYKHRLMNAPTQQKNTLIFGLRGVGKSVLLKALEKTALENGYVPVLKELSKRNNNEDELIQSLLADISIRLKGISISKQKTALGISHSVETIAEPFDLSHLIQKFNSSPGDKGDRLMATLIFVSEICLKVGSTGLVLLLDEFQLLEDNKDSQSYAMSLILDSISRIQSTTAIPIHAVIAGLPSVVGKMADSKPHIERLFSNVIDLGALNYEETRLAISEPLTKTNMANKFTTGLVDYLAKITEGYPFFIQYFANEAFVNFQHDQISNADFEKILPEINTKLDEHFYAPRFFNLSNKERAVVLATSNVQTPFSPTDLLSAVQNGGGEITMGAIQQYLLTLQEKNILYKVRRGTYDYAIPLLKHFLARCIDGGEDPKSVLKELGQR